MTFCLLKLLSFIFHPALLILGKHGHLASKPGAWRNPRSPFSACVIHTRSLPYWKAKRLSPSTGLLESPLSYLLTSLGKMYQVLHEIKNTLRIMTFYFNITNLNRNVHIWFVCTPFVFTPSDGTGTTASQLHILFPIMTNLLLSISFIIYIC